MTETNMKKISKGLKKMEEMYNILSIEKKNQIENKVELVYEPFKSLLPLKLNIDELKKQILNPPKPNKVELLD